MFRVLVVLTVMLTFSIPFTALAQFPEGSTLTDADRRAAITAGERDAVTDVNSDIWFALGCVTPLIGVVASYVYTPNSSRMIGKSSEYILVYTEAYKAKARSLQSKAAINGCFTSAGVSAALMLLVLLRNQ